MGVYFQRILDFWNTIFMFLHYRKSHIFHTRSTAALFHEPLDLQLILANRQKCEYSDMLCYTQTCWTTWWEVHIAVFIAPCRLLHGKVLRTAPIKHLCLYLFLCLCGTVCKEIYPHKYRYIVTYKYTYIQTHTSKHVKKIIWVLVQWYIKFPIYLVLD